MKKELPYVPPTKVPSFHAHNPKSLCTFDTHTIMKLLVTATLFGSAVAFTPAVFVSNRIRVRAFAETEETTAVAEPEPTAVEEPAAVEVFAVVAGGRGAAPVETRPPTRPPERLAAKAASIGARVCHREGRAHAQ